MSPLATPLLMMSPLRSGRYRLPIAWTSSRPEDEQRAGRGTAGGRSGAGRSSRRLRGVGGAGAACRRLGDAAASTGAPSHRPEADRGSAPARRRSAGRGAARGLLAALLADVAEDRAGRPRSGGRGRPAGRRSSWRRSTRPRSSIRSTIPVALATETSRASASLRHRQRAVGLEDGQDVEVDEAERALAASAGTRPSARAGSTTSSRRRARRPRACGRAQPGCMIFNVTLTIYVSVDHSVKRATAPRVSCRACRACVPVGMKARSRRSSRKISRSISASRRAAARRSSRPRAAPGGAAARPGRCPASRYDRTVGSSGITTRRRRRSSVAPCSTSASPIDSADRSAPGPRPRRHRRRPRSRPRPGRRSRRSISPVARLEQLEVAARTGGWPTSPGGWAASASPTSSSRSVDVRNEVRLLADAATCLDREPPRPDDEQVVAAVGVAAGLADLGDRADRR